jgi:hypothetical protein
MIRPWPDQCRIRRDTVQYEYMVKTKGMSLFDDIEGFGKSLENALNNEGNAYAELGWELWHVHILNDSDFGNNGLLYVYRRPHP